jgi:spore coat protein U domain-containing protein, fimbrial subunit CupE1/2/3/6
MRPQSATRRRGRRALAALMALAVLAPWPARAAGGATCSVSTTPLVFGKYVPSATSPSDFTATITLTCAASGTTPVPIHATIALTSAGGASARRLTAGARQLRYQLYLDPAKTVLWGDGSSGNDVATVSGVVDRTTPFRQAFTVYGRILARQSSTLVGNYGDQITVVLHY